MQYIHPARTSRIRRYLLITSMFQIVSGLGSAITGSMAFILHQTGSNIGLLSAAGIWSGFILICSGILGLLFHIFKYEHKNWVIARIFLSCMTVTVSATAFALHLYGTRTKISMYLSAFLAVGFICSLTKTSIVSYDCCKGLTSEEVNTRVTVAPGLNYPYLQVPAFVEPIPQHNNSGLLLQTLGPQSNNNPIVINYPQGRQHPISQNYSSNSSAFVAYKPPNSG